MNINKKMLLHAIEKLNEIDKYGYVDINDLANQYLLLSNTNVSKNNLKIGIDAMLKDLLDIQTCNFAIQKLQKDNISLSRNIYKYGTYYNEHCKNIIRNCEVIQTISNNKSINILINATSYFPVVCSDLLSEFKRIM